MVICCAAPNCTNRQGKGTRGAVSFHRFPHKDTARLYLWTAAIQRSDWTPGPYSFLCSEHFTLDSFLPRMPDQHPLLRPNAVPSLFKHSRENQRKGALEKHVLGIGRRKQMQKRRKLSSVQENMPPMYSNIESMEENGLHFNIRENMNPSFLQKTSTINTACRFIYSLHSYSQSSATSLLQNVVNMNVPPCPQTEEMTCEMSAVQNGQCLSSVVQDSGCFFSQVDHSQGIACHIEVNDSNELISIAKDTSELDQTEMDNVILESCEVCVEESCDYMDEPDDFLFQEYDSLHPNNVNWLHSYCSTSNYLPKRHQCLTMTCDTGWSADESCRDPLSLSIQDVPPLNPVVAPLAWMLGTWVSDPLGEGEFPSIPSFRYTEKAVISHVGQPMLNFTFSASSPETGKPLHRECGFIRVKPGTNQVAFLCAQNLGVVEVEEGEVLGEELTLTSHSLGRISFAKEPHVQKICRTFRLTPEGKLEQTVSMATNTQTMAPHLRVTYKKVIS